MSEETRSELLRGRRGLYAIVDSDPEGAGAISLGRALLDGGARILQLRMKGAEASTMLAIARELAPLCRAQGTLFIVNDRLDVALAAGADGAHLGQDDLPIEDARFLAPANFLLGVSTHNEDQAEAAARAGADYIGFGPVFPTSTKQNPDPVVGLERLSVVCSRVSIPVVAIGGISLSHAGSVARAGARFAAIISAVNRANDVVTAARTVERAFAID